MKLRTVLPLLLLLVCAAWGQVDPFQTKVRPLKVSNAPVRDVLKDLFKQVGVSYSVAPDVSGRVTLDLPAGSFETAFQAVLQQTGATYRGGGVLQIVRREAPDEAGGTEEVRLVDVDIATAVKELSFPVKLAPGVSGSVTVVGEAMTPDEITDALARQVDARVVKNGEYRLVPRNSLRKPLAQLQRKDADLRELVTDLMRSTGVNFVISGGIVGKTTVNLENTDVATALDAILAPIGARVTLRKGVFVVTANNR